MGDKRKMNEEELFCKLFPEYVVNGRPLSPYFDLFESGYEQAENRIEELRHTIAELRRDKDNLNTHTKAQEKLSEYRSDNLTNAKEIIRELVGIIDYLNEDEYGKEDFPVVHKAEAFLNSEVEK